MDAVRNSNNPRIVTSAKAQLEKATADALRSKAILSKAIKDYNAIMIRPSGDAVPNKPAPITEDKLEKEIKTRSKGIIRAEDLFTDQAYAELQQRISDAVLGVEIEYTAALAAGDQAEAQRLKDISGDYSASY